MNARVVVEINGQALAVEAGSSLLSALQQAGVHCTRRALDGAPRFAVCGMGVCQECALTIDGVAGQLACLSRCRDGMRVRSDD